MIEPYLKIQTDNLSNEGKAAYSKVVEFIGCIEQKKEKIKEIENDVNIMQEKSKFEDIIGENSQLLQTNITEVVKDKKQSIEK